jgi:hypothetical protein
MILRLQRDTFGTDATLGVLTVDHEDGRGPLAFGFVCEDQDRGLKKDMHLGEITAIKVKGETAIPSGRYTVARTWSPKYQRMMMLLADVPGFQGIRIHAGNDDDDTEGCILPGLGRDVAKMTVSKSRVAADWLDGEVAKCATAGKPVTMEITRDPAAWLAFAATGGAK